MAPAGARTLTVLNSLPAFGMTVKLWCRWSQMHKARVDRKVTDEKSAFDKQWAEERAQRKLIEDRKEAELQAERVSPEIGPQRLGIKFEMTDAIRVAYS
eukprot:676923-Prorocentrum_minimum.AAC.4